jgi:hypothetical protein
MLRGLQVLFGGVFAIALFAGTSHATAQALGQSPVQAPAQPPSRTVKVEEAEDGRMHWLLPKINQEVINAFNAKIAASGRYTLTQYAVTQSPAELLVVIVCQDSAGKATELLKASAVGFCTYRFEYSPKKIPEFDMPLGEPKVVGGTQPSDIAEDIFEEFVKETTETRLSAAETEVTLRVANFCSKPGNQLPCSGKFQ